MTVRTMRTYLIRFAALLLLMLTGWQANNPTRFVFTEASTLWVTGTSSLHDWRCDAAHLDGWLDTNPGQTPTGITHAELTVPADGLACKNGTMDKKARNALRADEHPTIRYELTAAEVVPGAEQHVRVETTGRLTLAGQTRTVTASLAGQWTAEGALRLRGEVPVLMSDYGIEPPKAMLGTLKTGDAVTVHFEVVAALPGDV